MNKNIILLSFFTILFTFFSTSLMAQNPVEGFVYNATNKEPVEYATIAVLTKDSTYVSGTVTNESGYFSLNVNKNDSYLLRVNCIGFKPSITNISVLGEVATKIELEENITELTEVSVIGQSPPIVNLGERVIVNVDSYTNTAGKSTVDVLKILPGITAERESFYLMGKSITVYINDKPSRLLGKDLTNYLSSLQGNQIDKVELLLNPTAKYDAGYNGAVINIKLKKNETLGLKGTIGSTTAAWGKDKYTMPTLNLNYRINNLNLYGGYTFLFNKFENKLEYEREFADITNPVRYDEKGRLKGLMRYHSYNLGLDYTLSQKHEVGFLFKGINNNTGKPNSVITKINDIGSNVIDSIMYSPIDTNSKSHNYQGNVNYRWKIDSVTTLNADINYMNVKNDSEQYIPVFYYLSDHKTEIRNQNGNGQAVDYSMSLWSGKIDFSHTILHDANLNIGFKYDRVKRNNDLIAYLNNNGVWDENTTQSNEFTYRENIYAGYFSFDKPIEKFYLSAGLRWELTKQEGFQFKNNESFDKTYNDWFPSLSLQYNVRKNQTIMMSYTRKTSRPAFSVMNPFQFYTSPSTFQVGNPDLKPSYQNSISLRYTLNRASLTLLYSSEDDMVVQEASQDDITKVLGYRYINFGSTKFYQASAYYPQKILGWWSVSLNATGGYKKFESLLNGDNFNKKFWYYNGSFYNTLNFGKGWSGDMYFSITSQRWSTATNMKLRGYMDASVTKSLWNDRASVSLAIEDPFKWSTFRSTYKFQNINERTKEVLNTRMVKVSFLYKFGSSKIQNKRNRSTGVEDIQQRIN